MYIIGGTMKIDGKKILVWLFSLMREKFYGKVVFSFQGGKITNVRKEQSISLEEFEAEDAVNE
ncbi:MAG TPA: hypothetical protein DCX03_00975 [Bacteroidales bacterium]|nr:hypothetical protein [Bacteroidales bacterium]